MLCDMLWNEINQGSKLSWTKLFSLDKAIQALFRMAMDLTSWCTSYESFEIIKLLMGISEMIKILKGNLGVDLVGIWGLDPHRDSALKGKGRLTDQ